MASFNISVLPEIKFICDSISMESVINLPEINYLPKTISPKILLTQLQRHRLFPQFQQALTVSSPDLFSEPPWQEFIFQLKNRYDNNRLRMLGKARLILKINDLLESRQIHLLMLKGPVMALQLYGDMAAKSSVDIDILVNIQQVQNVVKLFLENGFELVDLHYLPSPKQFSYLLANFHHLRFKAPENNIHVELHWNMHTNRFLAPYSFEDLYNKAQIVKLGGSTVLLPSPLHQTIYLMVHGSYHIWSRLDWLYDFAYSLHNSTPEFRNRVMEESMRMKIPKIYESSVWLAKYFFAPGKNLPGTSAIPPGSARLIKPALRSINKPYISANDQSLSRISSKIYLTRLKSSFRYKFHVWSVLLTNVGDWNKIRLPDRLFFVYFLLRPILYLLRTLPKKRRNKNHPAL